MFGVIEKKQNSWSQRAEGDTEHCSYSLSIQTNTSQQIVPVMHNFVVCLTKAEEEDIQ